MKKFISVLCITFMLVSCVSCSDSKQEVKKEPAKNYDEINKKYDEMFGEGNTDKPIGSDVSVLGEDFSMVDFTFTSPDDTVAFNLNDNSFAKMNEGGTYYNTIAPGGEVMTFESGYKTARGLTVQNTAQEFLNTYKIPDGNALFVKPDDDVYYNPANGNFNGRLTVLFGSEDSVTYKMLSSDDVQKFIYARNDIVDGAYMDPAKIMNKFSSYKSLVSIDITADEIGNVTEFAMYKFDK